MSNETVQRFAGILTIVANAIVVLRVCVAVGRRTGARSRIDAFVATNVAPVAVPGAFAVALTTTLGSLWFSERAHFTPCKLCWLQRIGIYPLVVILLVVMVRRDLAGRVYAIALAACTVPISVYHYLVEWYPNLETTSCDPTAPCTAVWFRELGYMSLSYMAGSAALAVISLLTLAGPLRAADHPDTTVEEA